MSSKNEQELIEAAQRRDLASFAVLVQRHHAQVRACLAVRMNNSHDAEDLTQDVFVTAFRKIRDCDASRPIGPWFRGIAMKHLANFRRKNRPFPVGSLDDLQVMIDEGMESFIGASAEEGTAMEALVECLEKIEEPAKMLLLSRYGDGETLEEIASQCGRKVSAVSMQLHRLRTVLGDCIVSKMNTSGEATGML